MVVIKASSLKACKGDTSVTQICQTILLKMEGYQCKQISRVRNLAAPPPGHSFLLACEILFNSLLSEFTRIGAHILVESFKLDRRAFCKLAELTMVYGQGNGQWNNGQNGYQNQQWNGGGGSGKNNQYRNNKGGGGGGGHNPVLWQASPAFGQVDPGFAFNNLAFGQPAQSSFGTANVFTNSNRFRASIAPPDTSQLLGENILALSHECKRKKKPAC